MSEMRKIGKKTILKEDANRIQEFNRGSAVVEMTLLIPIIFGVIYFGIMFFLFLIRSGNCMEIMAKHLYSYENTMDGESSDMLVNEQKKGNMKTVWVEEEGKLFQIRLELKGNSSDPVSVVRRWQIAIDTVSK